MNVNIEQQHYDETYDACLIVLAKRLKINTFFAWTNKMISILLPSLFQCQIDKLQQSINLRQISHHDGTKNILALPKCSAVLQKQRKLFYASLNIVCVA